MGYGRFLHSLAQPPTYYNTLMSGDLLQTKLYMPRLRPSLIPRLIKKLNQGLQQDCKLTLISAPAGFGKTTLISDYGLRIQDLLLAHCYF
ncbi:MAG: hypothetical protein GY805_01815 [Chloroflexi bacterium]|nr:hypothetical protein [Chloroflexota bacterium]